MQKIKFMADTACDIPDEDLQRYNIDLASVPIAIDGESYFERRSFGIREFYSVLAKTDEIPATSRVPASDFADCYLSAFKQGYTDIINVTINSGGSGTNAAAHMAAEQFFRDFPAAQGKVNIHIVDSRTYSMAYGYPVVQGAKMAEEGKSVEEILIYINNWLDSLEIYLGCYTLDYAKKSGRINAAKAFVGDMLGLRPIISMIRGDTKNVDKVRGEKNIVPRLYDMFKQNCADRGAPVIVICGEDESCGLALKALLEQDLGHEVPMYYAGASIVINAVPKIAAVIFKGK